LRRKITAPPRGREHETVACQRAVQRPCDVIEPAKETYDDDGPEDPMYVMQEPSTDGN
jgi:hypothetical protein